MTGLEMLENLARALSVFAPWPPPRILVSDGVIAEDVQEALDRAAWPVVVEVHDPRALRVIEGGGPRPLCPACGWPWLGPKRGWVNKYTGKEYPLP